MNAGIYVITSKTSNLIYIGGSQELTKRWNRHLNDLKTNKHHCTPLQNHYNDKGVNDLDFEVIKRCEPKDVKELEQKYLDDAVFNNTFNLSKYAVAGDLISYHPNRDLIIEKIKATLNKRYSSLSKEDKKRIYGKKKEQNGNWKGGVTYCECGSKKNYYADKCIKCTSRSGKDNPFYGKTHSKETIEKLRKANIGKTPSNAKKVKVGNIVFNSASAAAKELGCTPSTILNRIKKEIEGYSFTN